MNTKYYPIEVLHWSGMTDECLPELQHILNECPEYINAENINKDNALIIASRMDNQNIVKYLINDTNININHTVKEGNALNVASEYSRKEIVQLLLTKPININQTDNNGYTPLFHAARNGNDSIIEELLNHNADINILDNNKRNIFFSLIETYLSHKNYYAFELLLEKIDNDTLFAKDSNGEDIIDFMHSLIETSRKEQNILKEEALKKQFDYLFNILECRK